VRHAESAALHRKEENFEMLRRKAHSSEHVTEEDKLQREHAAIDLLKRKFKWIKILNTVRAVSLHMGVAKKALSDARHAQELQSSAIKLQNAMKLYRFNKERKDAAGIVKKLWKFRNVAVKKRYCASVLQAFLSEGRLVHNWWLLSNQIRQQAVFLQSKIRSFIACQRARLYVLHCAWYVAERRVQGHQDARIGNKPTKTSRQDYEKRRKEEMKMIAREEARENLKHVKDELEGHKHLAVLGGAGHLKKGQGARKKSMAIMKRRNNNEGDSQKEKRSGGRKGGNNKTKDKGPPEMRTKSGKLIKTHDTKVSTSGILSWVSPDSLTVKVRRRKARRSDDVNTTFLEAFEALVLTPVGRPLCSSPLAELSQRNSLGGRKGTASPMAPILDRPSIQGAVPCPADSCQQGRGDKRIRREQAEFPRQDRGGEPGHERV
jgi:hypothetical protein